MKGHNNQLYQTGRVLKEPEPRTLTEKPQWAIVDRKHKLVYHKDGHALLFPRKKDAQAWLNLNDQTIPEDWRVMKVSTFITTI